MGASTRQEGPVRSIRNRQTRRSSLCNRARRPSGRRRVISPGRVALTAYGPGVAEIASFIADDLELPGEMVELLSPAGVPSAHSGRMFERELQAVVGSGRER